MSRWYLGQTFFYNTKICPKKSIFQSKLIKSSHARAFFSSSANGGSMHVLRLRVLSFCRYTYEKRDTTTLASDIFMTSAAFCEFTAICR